MPRTKKTPAIIAGAPTLAAEQSLERLPVLFPIGRIHVAPENPRHDINDEELAALKDSISASGILMPLIGYIHEQHAFITVGGRRTRALHILTDEGAWDMDALNVPVIVMPREEAIRAGVTEQLSHVAMSEHDVLRAFTTPYFAGLSNADCAKHMGLTAREVAKRRRVLELPQEILEALWTGQIVPDQAVGLTYFIDAPEALMEFFSQALDDPNFGSDAMREGFAEGTPDWQDFKPCKFITQEAYLAAGGKLQADFFTGSQYVLDTALAVELAEEAIIAKTKAERLCHEVYFLQDGIYPKGYHPGVPQITAEEHDELKTFWADQEKRKAQPDRYAQLQAKQDNVFPDELESLLDVALKWLPPSHEHSYQIYRRVLPEDREPLYLAGFSKRPDPQVEAARDEMLRRQQERANQGLPPEANKKDPLLPSGAVLQDAQKVLAHVHRQRLIQEPHTAFNEWLKHMATRTSYTFSSVRQETDHAFTDIPVVFHRDWTKAASMASDALDIIHEYKPAQARLVTAWRLLSCLTPDYAKGHPLDARQVREFFSPDEKWMARYTSAQLTHMLGSKRLRELTQAIAGVPNKNALVRGCVKLAKEEADWLPMGFPQFKAPEAVAEAPANPKKAEEYARTIAPHATTSTPNEANSEADLPDGDDPICGDCQEYLLQDEATGEWFCPDCDDVEEGDDNVIALQPPVEADAGAPASPVAPEGFPQVQAAE